MDSALLRYSITTYIIMNLNAIKKLRAQLDKHHYKCKEGCFECCTAVPTTEEEAKLIEKELRKQGYKEPPNGKGEKYCEMLTPEGRCSVYEQRPIICRGFSDIKYRIARPWKEVFTWACTYGSWEVRNASQEFIQYGKEILKKGIVIGNVDEKHLVP